MPIKLEIGDTEAGIGFIQSRKTYSPICEFKRRRVREDEKAGTLQTHQLFEKTNFSLDFEIPGESLILKRERGLSGLCLL